MNAPHPPKERQRREDGVLGPDTGLQVLFILSMWLLAGVVVLVEHNFDFEALPLWVHIAAAVLTGLAALAALVFLGGCIMAVLNQDERRR